MNAPVKNQCSRDYFYGTDEKLENAIQLVESSYGLTLREIIQNNRAFTEKNKAVLKTFWLFQHLRTEAAATRTVQMAESTRTLASLPPDEFSLGIKEAVQIACRAFVDTMHQIDDLKFCIVKNRTRIPFITSDNPAVMTNKWRLEKDKAPGHSFGTGSAGMLAILPLTPKLLFLGYDGDVYSVPNEKGIVNIKQTRDVISFNRHQFLQCVSNVYIHDPEYGESISKHNADVESIRPKERHVVHYAQYDCTVGNHKRYLIVSPDEIDKEKEGFMHSQVIHPHPEMWPSQIRIRTNGSVYTNGTGVGYIRAAQTLVKSGRDFWREHP